MGRTPDGGRTAALLACPAVKFSCHPVPVLQDEQGGQAVPASSHLRVNTVESQTPWGRRLRQKRYLVRAAAA
ncbi:hypothetical protein GCM10010499_50450 [Streptomyces thermoviolaceus subsp. apingens]|nr:hypothetical protein GCM10010499_50450 [Streptomyces thermoviolaceus subsp. apingens]